MTKSLEEMAMDVDVLELAGQIIANTRRTQVSLAGELALARAVENCWAVCVEADVLVRALGRPVFSGSDAAEQERDMLIETQAAIIRKQLAAMRGEKE